MKDLFSAEFFVITLASGASSAPVSVAYLPLQLRKWGSSDEQLQLEYQVRKEVVERVLREPESLGKVLKDVGSQQGPAIKLVLTVLSGRNANLDEATANGDPELVLTALLVAKVQEVSIPVSIFENHSAMKRPLVRMAIANFSIE